jgi:hypothetical protein
MSNKLLDYLQGELASDQPTTTLLNAMKVLQPGIDRLVYDAKQSATQAERTESVCRLLAGGMTVEEVIVVLCLRRDEVDAIAESNGEKIAKYAKTLKERQKRHGLNTYADI